MKKTLYIGADSMLKVPYAKGDREVERENWKWILLCILSHLLGNEVHAQSYACMYVCAHYAYIYIYILLLYIYYYYYYLNDKYFN